MIRTHELLDLLRDAAVRRGVMALWVCILLLKLTVPLLAVWAARVNDVAVGDICSVYGFHDLHYAQPESGHHGDGGDANHAGRCPLTGVVAASAILLSLVALLLATLVWTTRSTWGSIWQFIAPDGPGDWQSRLAHAPPCPA